MSTYIIELFAVKYIPFLYVQKITYKDIISQMFKLLRNTFSIKNNVDIQSKFEGTFC